MPTPRTDLSAPMQATLVAWHVGPGDAFDAGDLLAVLEAMKMEHELRATAPGRVRALRVQVGEMVAAGEALLQADSLSKQELPRQSASAPEADLASNPASRPELARLRERLAFTYDAARPHAMAKRQAQGQRSARENIADVCDAGSFTEYGALALAAQRSRRSEDELIRETPADGMVCGAAQIHGAPAVVMAYDATVLAGTQGARNHAKTDRLLQLAWRNRLPVLLFAEGGGGRPGDVDMPIVAGLHVGTFAAFARLSGRVPLVGVAAGRCFAGNAALVGCCDIVIATQGASIGMSGPAMVEGGGLGRFAPEEIGPSAVQHANGVIDVLVPDDAAAAHAARHVMGYFVQPHLPEWTAPTGPDLREVVPHNRVRSYDSRSAMQGIADAGSLLALRTGWGQGVHTALARIEGRAVGLLANNPLHLGGAIDAPAADKAAQFIGLCSARGLPIVSLVDTPGFMVGPQSEAQGQVRAAGRLFVAAARCETPIFSVVLRKGYGLGAMAMAAGGFHEGDFTIAWPTGEFGAMGLEGAVKLGFKRELAAQPEGPAREALFAQLLAQQVEAGQALNMAATLEIDAVIDPQHTRQWLARGLAAAAGRG